MHPDSLEAGNGSISWTACGPQQQSSWDERRGVHLLGVGDLVSYEGEAWRVTGVHFATERRFSTVTLALGDQFETELRLPLAIVEGACDVFLKAGRCPLPS